MDYGHRLSSFCNCKQSATVHGPSSAGFCNQEASSKRRRPAAEEEENQAYKRLLGVIRCEEDDSKPTLMRLRCHSIGSYIAKRPTEEAECSRNYALSAVALRNTLTLRICN